MLTHSCAVADDVEDDHEDDLSRIKDLQETQVQKLTKKAFIDLADTDEEVGVLVWFEMVLLHVRALESPETACRTNKMR